MEDQVKSLSDSFKSFFGDSKIISSSLNFVSTPDDYIANDFVDCVFSYDNETDIWSKEEKVFLSSISDKDLIKELSIRELDVVLPGLSIEQEEKTDTINNDPLENMSKDDLIDTIRSIVDYEMEVHCGWGSQYAYEDLAAMGLDDDIIKACGGFVPGDGEEAIDNGAVVNEDEIPKEEVCAYFKMPDVNRQEKAVSLASCERRA